MIVVILFIYFFKACVQQRGKSLPTAACFWERRLSAPRCYEVSDTLPCMVVKLLYGSKTYVRKKQAEEKHPFPIHLRHFNTLVLAGNFLFLSAIFHPRKHCD